MELVFKTVFDIARTKAAKLGTLSAIQQAQFLLAARSIWGHKLDLDDGYLDRYQDEFEELLESGVRFLHVFSAGDDTEPLYDVWSDRIDCVQVFHHNTTTKAGAVRIQGGFDPRNKTNADDVALADALDDADLKASRDDRP